MLNRTIPSEATYGAGRDPLTAAILSIVPGLGQLYIGERRKGILFLDVTALNTVLLGLMLYSRQILEGLQKFGTELHFQVNGAVMVVLQHAHIGTPASGLILALMLGFGFYAARDAYDRAAGLRRRYLYKDHFVELSEATSGSYLIHFAVMGACAVLALFFLSPPPKLEQKTQIFLDLEPVKKQAPTHETDNVAYRESVKSGTRDWSRPTVATRPTANEKPDVNTNSKPAQSLDGSANNQRPGNNSVVPAPAPRPLRIASAIPLPQPLAPVVTPEISKSELPRPVHAGATDIAKLPTLPIPSLAKAVLIAPPQPTSMLRTHVPTDNVAPLPNRTALLAFTGQTIDPLKGATSAASSRIAGGITPSAIAPRSVHATTSTASAPAPIELAHPPGASGSNGAAPGEAISIKGATGPGRTVTHIPQKVATRVGGSGIPTFATQPTGSSASPQTALPNPDTDSHPGPISFDAKEANFGPYMADLQRRIRKHWFPPVNYESRRVIACFTVDKDGYMSDLRMVTGSGHAPADAAALNAIRSASPFRPLPEHAPASVDIEFTFDYTVFSRHF